MLATEDERYSFIQKTEQERKRREEQRKLGELALRIQCLVRRRAARSCLGDRVRADFDRLFVAFEDLDASRSLPACSETLRVLQVFFFVLDRHKDLHRICQMCRYMVLSVASTSRIHSFVTLFLSKSHIESATRLISKFFSRLPPLLSHLEVSRCENAKVITVVLHCLVVMSRCNGWRMVAGNQPIIAVLTQLCQKMVAHLGPVIEHFATLLFAALNRAKPALPSETINALFALSFRPVKDAAFKDDLMSTFVTRFLTIPAVTSHICKTSLEQLLQCGIFEQSVALLNGNLRLVKGLSSSRNLNLLANLVHLSTLDQKALVENLLDWTALMQSMLCNYQAKTIKKKPHHGVWHPIFGWQTEILDDGTLASIPQVSNQLRLLWSKEIVRCMFDKVLSCDLPEGHKERLKHSTGTNDLTVSLKKLWKKLNVHDEGNRISTSRFSRVSMTAVVCQFYQIALSTFTNIHTGILSGLCQEDYLLPRLWEFISASSLEVDGPLTGFLELVNMDPACTHPSFCVLTLFCDASTCVISQSAMAIFNSVYHLASILYNRDCRRSFTNNPKFWLARDSRSSALMADFTKRVDRARFLMERMPHLVPHRERVMLFRTYIAQDKETADGTSTRITIHRDRIVEDGYRQLALLDSRAIRATIRVKFINEQGLDEAGIDQDGVFKEFLEMTLRKVFHPDFNLFVAGDKRQLYPSPNSWLHEQHEDLFYFVGALLAKAVYEGIVIDVNLAGALLSALVGRSLSAFDELSDLDPDLYKSLTYVKHYKDSDDVSDLHLTFSVDEDVLGKMQTVDIIEGGRTLQVNNANKILYVHRMARYRVVDQTRAQCSAFVRGFHSVVSPNWLSLFGPQEMQLLISGTRSDIDMKDLKSHVQYYGGFHSNHRLIKWLWDILEHDFDLAERQLFLKFVTSCSQAPLLGFAYLEPPFSIRCVEVGDDQDQGDTLGSVVRGFLALRRKEPALRLPTASTCFNLLKLPNYSKRTTLLEKLRYAIHSETGFELS